MTEVFLWTGFVVLMAILFLMFLFIAFKILELIGRIMRKSNAIWMGAVFYWHGKQCPNATRQIIIDYIKHVNVDDPYCDYEMKQAIEKASKAITEAKSKENHK